MPLSTELGLNGLHVEQGTQKLDQVLIETGMRGQTARFPHSQAPMLRMRSTPAAHPH
jgi:hypothetical protein